MREISDKSTKDDGVYC